MGCRVARYLGLHLRRQPSGHEKTPPEIWTESRLARQLVSLRMRARFSRFSSISLLVSKPPDNAMHNLQFEIDGEAVTVAFNSDWSGQALVLIGDRNISTIALDDILDRA